MSEDTKPVLSVVPPSASPTDTISIKGFPKKTYADARAAAKNARMTMGEWAAIAFQERIDREAGHVVFPPGQSAPSTSVVAFEDQPSWAFPDISAPPPPPVLDMSGLAQVLSAVALASSRDDRPVPKSLLNDSVAATRAHLRQVRGLPPLKPRKAKEFDVLNALAKSKP